MSLAPSDPFLEDACRACLAPCWPKPQIQAVEQAMDQIFALADGAWNARRRRPDFLMETPKIACAAGCGWCCHQQVGISVPEAVRIARHLDSLPAAQAGLLRRNVRQTAQKVAALTPGQRARARIACAFLGADGSCQIYDVRPLRCRGLYSIDRDFCIACHDDIDAMQAKLEQGLLRPVFLTVPPGIFDSALSGILQVLARHAPKALVSLELNAAIDALTADPRLGQRWLAGRAPGTALHLLAPVS